MHPKTAHPPWVPLQLPPGLSFPFLLSQASGKRPHCSWLLDLLLAICCLPRKSVASQRNVKAGTHYSVLSSNLGPSRKSGQPAHRQAGAKEGTGGVQAAQGGCTAPRTRGEVALSTAVQWPWRRRVEAGGSPGPPCVGSELCHCPPAVSRVYTRGLPPFLPWSSTPTSLPS